MRTVLFKAKISLWMAYLGDVAVLALDRFIFTMFIPFLEVCARATVLNSVFGNDIDTAIQVLIIPSIIVSDYYVRQFYIESPPGSTITSGVLRGIRPMCKEILSFGGAFAKFLLGTLKLGGAVTLLLLRLCTNFALSLLQLSLVVMLVVPFGLFEIWRILGTAAPAVRVLGAIGIVNYYTDSVFIAVMVAILLDMFTDPRFQGKFLPLPMVSNGPLTRRLADGFLDGVYNRPPPPPPAAESNQQADLAVVEEQ